MTFVDEVQKELDAANRSPRLIKNMGCLALLGIVCVFGMIVVAGGIGIAKLLGAF